MKWKRLKEKKKKRKAKQREEGRRRRKRKRWRCICTYTYIETCLRLKLQGGFGDPNSISYYYDLRNLHFLLQNCWNQDIYIIVSSILSLGRAIKVPHRLGMRVIIENPRAKSLGLNLDPSEQYHTKKIYICF